MNAAPAPRFPSSPSRRAPLSGACALAVALAFAPHASAAAPPDDLTELLRRHLDNNPALPSLCAAVIVDGALQGGGAAGVRKKGDPTPVTFDDSFHIGSCTKSMTATLAAILVEEGKLKWEATVGEALGSLRPDAGYAKATLAQLLTNTGGFPGNVPPDIWVDAWKARGSNRGQRGEFVEAMLRRAPAYVPGEGYEYSNTGFSVAGHLMEVTAKESWEDLVTRRIFAPLGMKTGGFREPAAGSGAPRQPWGHRAGGEPVPPGDEADNPAAIAPAGAVHCSLADLARYVLLHLERKPGGLIAKAETFDKLHTAAAAENYAMGWIVAERPWAGGPALTHTGSNTMFTTVIWMAPKRRFAAIVATNIGVDAAARPCDAVVGDLIKRYLP